MDGRNLKLGLTAILAMVILAVIALLSMQPAGATITGDLPPAMGDWVINNPTTVIDESVYIWDGNITVNARLTVWNSVIYLDSAFIWDYWDLTVSKGVTLQSNDSMFQSYWGYFDCFVDGTMDLDNCDMYWMNDFNISGTVKANYTNIRYGSNLDNRGIFQLTSYSHLYGWTYLKLGGTVTVDSSRIERTYSELAIRGTCRFINSQVYYTYGLLNLTGTGDFNNCDVYYVNSEFRLTGTAKMNGSQLRYLYGGLNHTGALSITYGYAYRIYRGMWLAGDASIDGSEFWYVYEGVHISVDKVSITNTVFENMYDMGLHVDHCDPALTNVSIDVYTGTATRYFTTDQAWSWENPFPIAIGNGIWVEGGSPKFTEVSVYASSNFRFEVEYTGTDSDVEIYTRAMAAVVLIESKEMTKVSDITVYSSSFNIYAYFRATDPGTNPLYFYGRIDLVSAGIGVVNYDSVTITDVDVGNVYYRSIYRYCYGGYYSNSASAWYGPSSQLAGAVMETYSDNARTSLVLRDMEVDMAYGLLNTYWMPGYSGSGVPTLTDTVLVENVTVNYAYDRDVFYFYSRPRYAGNKELMKTVSFSRCMFSDISTRLVYYSFEPGPMMDPTQQNMDVTEDLNFLNCTLKESRYDGTYIYMDGMWYSMQSNEWDRTVTFADSTFMDYVGSAWTLYGRYATITGKDTLNVRYCHFENLTDAGSSRGPFYTYYFDTVRFMDNTMMDTDYGETADFYDYGGDNTGVKRDDWLFEDNIFSNCTNRRWSEIINLDYGGDVVIRGNDIGNMNGLISMWHETEYAGAPTLTVEDNVFHDNTAYIVEFGNTNDGNRLFTVIVTGNEFYNNEDYLFNYYGSSSTINAFSNRDATFIIEENDFHDNMGGLIHLWGDVAVRNNTFSDNAGPLVLIDYIDLNLPDISGNALSGNADLFFFVAKDRGYQLVAMKMADETLDCSGTALRFTNMEIELRNVDIAGAERAVHAINAFVNVYSSNIDGDACLVEADGVINSWWSMEVYVTWGDKVGTDSMTPVEEALIVFYDASDSYSSSSYTDDAGMLAAQSYRRWSVDLGGTHWLSPYEIKVAAAGATNSKVVNLDKDLVGNDKVHIILWDTYEPVVAITEPYDGAIYSIDHLNAMGFVTEVGSGLASAEYSFDGSSWLPMAVGDGGDWTLPLTEMMDGDVALHVRATDRAGNSKETMVTMTIDTTPPSLTVASLPTITNLAMLSITGTVETGAELFINGMSYGIDTDSIISEEISLHEGVNAIVIEAYDAAGNMAMKSFIVLLDTHAPVLVITGPANGMVTSRSTVTVTGFVEEGSTLTVDGEPVIVDEGGAFSHDVDLESGENDIVVMATDDATNLASAHITLVQDQVPPSVEITQPADGTVTKDSILEVHISADQDAKLWLNGRPLATSGLVVRTVSLLEGVNTITVKAMDMAGNEATDSVTIIRDTRPPVLVVTSPSAMEIWTNAATLAIAGTATDAEDVYVNGASANLVDEAFTHTANLAIGLNNVTIVASDGINEVTHVIKVWVRRDPPVLNVDAVEAIIKVPSVTIRGNTVAGIPWVTLTYGGVTETFAVNYDGTFATTLHLTDGTYNVQVEVEDAYGNVATGQTGSFEVKTRDYFPDTDGEEGIGVEPWHIGLLLVALGLALLIGAAWAYYTLSRREEME